MWGGGGGGGGGGGLICQMQFLWELFVHNSPASPLNCCTCVGGYVCIVSVDIRPSLSIRNKYA